MSKKSPTGLLSRRTSPPPIDLVASRLARANQVDPECLTGSGPGGRVTVTDVLAHLAEQSPPAGTPDELPVVRGPDFWTLYLGVATSLVAAVALTVPFLLPVPVGSRLLAHRVGLLIAIAFGVIPAWFAFDVRVTLTEEGIVSRGLGRTGMASWRDVEDVRVAAPWLKLLLRPHWSDGRDLVLCVRSNAATRRIFVPVSFCRDSDSSRPESAGWPESLRPRQAS
jgi:hypothetical protein